MEDHFVHVVLFSLLLFEDFFEDDLVRLDTLDQFFACEVFADVELFVNAHLFCKVIGVVSIYFSVLTAHHQVDAKSFEEGLVRSLRSANDDVVNMPHGQYAKHSLAQIDDGETFAFAASDRLK